MAEDARWLTDREQRAWRGLKLMEMRLESQLARQLASESGLSYPDYVVLVALTDSSDGRLRLFELGEVLSWEKSRLSHQIARMAKRGLVDKQRCGDDGRGAYVAITKQGRTEIAVAAPGHVAEVRRLFLDHLSPAQLDAIADIADTILSQFDKEATS